MKVKNVQVKKKSKWLKTKVKTTEMKEKGESE